MIPIVESIFSLLLGLALAVFGLIQTLSRYPGPGPFEQLAADATALTATRLLAIDGRALLAVLRQNPDAVLELVRMLGERLSRTTAQMEDTLFLPAEARLARALARLAALDPQPSGETLTIDLGLSQRELGELTGLSRESINKQLSVWRDIGLVGLHGRTLTLIDGAALSEIGESVEF